MSALEYAFNKLDWEEKGIRIDGERLTHLTFANYIVIIADNLEDAKDMVEDLQAATQRDGLKMNSNKTKMMTNLGPNKLI